MVQKYDLQFGLIIISIGVKGKKVELRKIERENTQKEETVSLFPSVERKCQKNY